MPKILKLVLSREIEIDLEKPEFHDLLIDELKLANVVGEATDIQVRDATKEILGNDMESLVTLDDLSENDFQVIVPRDHGLYIEPPEEHEDDDAEGPDAGEQPEAPHKE